jgi:hypothetical protein
MRRRTGLLTASCLTAVLAAGATFLLWPDPYAPHPAPTSHRQCNDRQPSRVDPAMVAVAFDVTSGHHADGTSATAFACIGHDVSVEVTVEGTGVRVTPSRFRAGDDVPPQALELSVAPGGHGRLRVVGRSRGLGFDMAGPRVVRDGDGWRVEPANE